jgi:hypothetical protein
MFSLEHGSDVANLTCDCCGKPFKSVCGFIKKDDWAYSDTALCMVTACNRQSQIANHQSQLTS